MPWRSASSFIASGHEMFLYFERNAAAFPFSPQPKQWKMCFSGDTKNDGVFSLWKGQSPLKFLPAGCSFTYSPTTSTMSDAFMIASIAC
ncbi:MAG TPA: hypothetical protein DCR44_01565 [Acholeplasmatales bacterium]|nr:hypothetical protein [Acholeplasmatales bacterium]